MRFFIIFFIGMLLNPLFVWAETNFTETIPQNPNIDQHYLIYLHGAIIERGDLTPTHPRFGLYDMPAIRAALSGNTALSDRKDISLISHHRASGTQTAEYAQKLADDIKTLLVNGVPAKNITIAGFSKGGAIAILTANILQNSELNYVIMAACNSWVFDNDEITLSGRVLSIFEATDTIGITCQPLMEKSQNVSEFSEIMLNTGKQHGAFYTPNPAWLQPLLNWVAVN